MRRVRRRAFAVPQPGDVLPIGRRRVRVRSVAQRVVERADVVEHIVEVTIAKNVVEMPVGDDSVVAQFLRYHVLVRVFDGDADAWLAQLRAHDADGGDLRFVHWIRSRLRQDPTLMTAIRKMVDATPFWHAAEA